MAINMRNYKMFERNKTTKKGQRIESSLILSMEAVERYGAFW